MSDPLGPVFDEPGFHLLLTREANRASRYRDYFSVCLMKPDLPEMLDDAGLQATATQIACDLRATDVVGRVADAIAVLLVNTPPLESVAVAERLRARMPTFLATGSGGEGGPKPTASLGLAVFPQDGLTAAQLLTRAGAYLERAVALGGDRSAHAAAGGP